MGIHVGGVEGHDVFVGSQPAHRVYVGSELVWERDSEPPPPEEITLVGSDVDPGVSAGGFAQVTIPATVEDGDIGLAFLASAGETDSVLTSGWDIVRSPHQISSSFWSKCYSKVLTEAEANTIVEGGNGTAQKYCLALIVLRGVDFIDGTESNHQLAAGGTIHTAPSVTATADGNAVTCWMERGSSPSTSVTQPTGWTLLEDGYGSGGGATSAGLAWQPTPHEPGTISPGDWEADSAQNTVVWTLALAAAIGGA